MWGGFIVESKKYMGYPECGKLEFWMQIPRAAIRFYWFEFLFIIKIKINNFFKKDS